MKLSHLNALRAFEAVLRTGSFRAAADELGVTTAAVGQQIRGLEAFIGRSLFSRTSAGAHPTDDATRLKARLTSGFSIIDGKRYDWSEKDIFVVPSWSLHEHGNASESEDACLFSFNDLPVMRALGIYHEEAYTGTPDGRQAIIAG